MISFKFHLLHHPFFQLVLLLTLLKVAQTTSASDEEIAEQHSPFLTEKVLATTRHDCHENGVIAAWCGGKAADVLKGSNTDCSIHPTLNLYMCTCEDDPKACPMECVKGTQLVSQQPHLIQCQGLPQDEPNYILTTPKGKLAPPDQDHQHCENNAIVASWCHEEPQHVDVKDTDDTTAVGLDCLLLPALDEYVCNCHHNPAACPDDCVGGTPPDKKTTHSIRCKGIPVDQPNYVLTQGKVKK